MTPERWHHITELFHRALTRGSADREAFLRDACGDDAELRAELESMLDAHAGATPIEVMPAVAPETRSLSAGTFVAQYRVDALIGVGGMGEVYLAHDSTLDRDVAIKTLPSSVARDPERLARFEREARVLASLNHRSIAAIYDVEYLDGVPALVLEWVGGETLDALAPLGVREALAIARQIADALATAHEKGIVHRDLKPSNVKVSVDGVVKILDFGLAKVLAADMELPSARGGNETVEGMVLGTAAYMSPEQARGVAVDKRTDIWAFGCVLYEMLAGRPAFPGATASDRLAAVLERSPDWSALPLTTPASIVRLLQRTVEKDPKQRLHDIADARIEIDESLNAPPAAVAAVTPSRAPLRPVVWTLGVLAVGLSLFGAARALGPFWSRRASAADSVARFVIQAPPRVSMAIGAFDISPDGSEIVFAGTDQTTAPPLRRLFVRRLDQFDARLLPGSDGATLPFFSPDGEWVGFVADGKLQKINVRTLGAPIVLCPVGDARGGFTWTAPDAIVFANAGGALLRAPSEGGPPAALTALDPADVDHHTARLLPDGTLLYAIREALGERLHVVREEVMRYSPATQRFKIVVESRASGRRGVLIAPGFDPHYAASGHIVYANGDALMAVPFDADRRAVTGSPVTLVESVATVPQNGYGGFRLSATGTLVYQPARSTTGRTLTWVTRSGTETPVPIPPRAFTTPRLSPDGTQVAFAVADGDRQDIWIYTIASDILTRATRDGINLAPMWTRDGKRLTYASNRGGIEHVMWQPADGSAAAEPLVTGRHMLWPNSWTRDGQVLVYVDAPPTDDYRVFTFRLTGSGARVPQPYGSHRQWLAFLSPDDRWIAFTSDEAGDSEIYVEDFPARREHHQVSVGGGTKALWSRDGRELFYRRDGAVFSVRIDTRHGFSAGKPTLLFRGTYVNNVLDYDVAPDGRFLMMKPGDDELAPPELRVVVNWQAELNRRVRAH